MLSYPPASLKSASLKLSAIGMRRKNLYITEVDVYNAGLYLSDAALKVAKDSKTKDPELESLPTALGDYLVQSGQKSPQGELATRLVFVRDVGQSSIVEAFNDAFKGCDTVVVDKFKKAYGEAVGVDGMKKGESCTFIWLNGSGGLVVEKNGVVTPLATSAELEKRLLQVYLQPKQAVSPELVKCIKDHV